MDLQENPMVRVGPAGWSYPDWKGIVYPQTMPRGGHPLDLVSAWFDTVEINSTFYRPANPKYAESWVDKVRGNPRFMFTAKLWEEFTHTRDAWPDARRIQEFKDGLQPLYDADKLGVVLIQFPWSFRRTPENRQRLARIVDTFPEYTFALEVRHASWDCPEFFEHAAQRDLTFCNIDQPLFKDSIAPSAHANSELAYVRLHGRNKADWFRKDAGRDDRYNYLYSEEELQPWIEKIEEMRRIAKNVYVITNNHYRGQAIVNAFEIERALGREIPKLPEHLLDAYPRLRTRLAKERC